MALHDQNQNFWQGGIADSPFMVSYKNGTVADAFGVDIFTIPGTVQASQALTKDSASSVTELCFWGFIATDGATLFFGELGAIFKNYTKVVDFKVMNITMNSGLFKAGDTITGNVSGAKAFILSNVSTATFLARLISGTFTLADTAITTDGSGGGSGTGHWFGNNPAYIKGAGEFNGFYYWTVFDGLNDQLYEMINSGNWTTNINSVAGFPHQLNLSDWHPMLVSSVYLAIGNGNELSTVDDLNTFTASGIVDVTLPDMLDGTMINSLIAFNEDILIGTGFRPATSEGGFATGALYRWDFSSSAYTDIKQVAEEGVYALIYWENVAVVFAGRKGNIYSFDGTSLTKLKTVPTIPFVNNSGDYYFLVYPGCVMTFEGKVLFTSSLNGDNYISGNIYNQGVWAFGQVQNGYPLALVCEYNENVAGTVDDNRTFGALVTAVNVFYASSRNNLTTTNVGIDLIKLDKKTPSGYFTVSINGNQETSKTFLEYCLGYKTLASGSFTVKSYVNYTSVVSPPTILDSTNDVTDYLKYFNQYKLTGRSGQFKVTIDTASARFSPIVDSFYVKWNEEEKI